MSWRDTGSQAVVRELDQRLRRYLWRQHAVQREHGHAVDDGPDVERQLARLVGREPVMEAA